MDRSRRSALGIGLVLILLGLAFLAGNLYPRIWDWVDGNSWPLTVVGAGAILMLIGLIAGEPGMAVPACIVSGIGGILYWQNATGHWESWAYAWALIPGFAGVGTMLMGLLSAKGKAVLEGGWTVIVSATLFVIFASFLGGPVLLGSYWPVLLIVLGVVLLFRNLFWKRAGE